MTTSPGDPDPALPPCDFKLLQTLTGHSRAVSNVKFCPTAGLIATASADKTAAVWEPDTGVCCCRLEGHDRGISDVSWSPDGKYICTASDDLTAKLWDAATGKCLRTLEGHTNFVFCSNFDPVGHLLVSPRPPAPAAWLVQKPCQHFRAALPSLAPTPPAPLLPAGHRQLRRDHPRVGRAQRQVPARDPGPLGPHYRGALQRRWLADGQLQL